ncbi:unnamed protein product [Effrenium voratum]|nr:unnamed protein product [Effrenium voratum]
MPTQGSPRPSFTRSASAIFSGGGVFVSEAHVRPPPRSVSEGSGLGADALLERQPTRRQVDSANVQQRLREEALQNIMGRCTAPLVLLCFVSILGVLVGSLLMIVLFWRALYATILYNHIECDQPHLKTYMLVTICVGTCTSHISQQVVSRMQNRGMSTRSVWVSSTLISMIPGWMTLYWGYSLLKGCQTCPETNPGLYYDVRDYVYFQIAASFTYLVVGIPAMTFAHRLLLALQAINSGEGMRGCADMIKNLPKIPNDSAELRDEDDGSIMECSICLGSFSSLPVVRTPCRHFFHEKCLTQWCQAHVSCPLCKSLVADPDRESAGPDKGEC